MSYVNNMSYVSRLYELLSHMSIFMNRLKHLFFKKKIGVFLLIYKDEKPKL